MVIYSVVAEGSCSTPIAPIPGLPCILLTDEPSMAWEGWETRLIPSFAEGLICPHRFIDAPQFVYVEAGMEVRRLEALLSIYRGGLMLSWHSEYSCPYQVATSEQGAAYKRTLMPEGIGLFSLSFLIRDAQFNRFADKWLEESQKWGELCASLMRMVWAYEPEVSVIRQEAMSRHVSLPTPKAGAQVWYFVPGAGDKNWGASINRHCSMVADDDDWILVRDNDTCFLCPEVNRQVEDIVAKHGDFDLLTCMTNRVGIQLQAPYGVMAESNILEIKTIADRHFADYYDEVIPTSKPTAGVFMLFRKRTWRKHPFKDGLAEGEFIDHAFSREILASGGKVGICKGVFLFHFYRMGRDVDDISHLQP